MSDAILVQRARRGDAAAFEALVRRHYRAAYAVALAMLGNAMDAEDVTQDAFVRAVERMDEVREPERFKGWLLQIVRNRSRNYRGYRRLRTTRPLDSVSAAAPENPATDTERAELRGALESALAELSDASLRPFPDPLDTLVDDRGNEGRPGCSIVRLCGRLDCIGQFFWAVKIAGPAEYAGARTGVCRNVNHANRLPCFDTLAAL